MEQHQYIIILLVGLSALIQAFVQLRSSTNSNFKNRTSAFMNYFGNHLLGIAISTFFFIPYIWLMNFIFHYPYPEPNLVIQKTIYAFLLITFLFFIRTVIKIYQKDSLVFTKEKKRPTSFGDYQLGKATLFSANLYSVFFTLSVSAYLALLYSNDWHEKPWHLTELGQSPERQAYLATWIEDMPAILPTLIFSMTFVIIMQFFLLYKTRQYNKKMTAFTEFTSRLDQLYAQLIEQWEALKQQNSPSFQRFPLINQFSYWDKNRYDQITLENSRMYEESKKLLEATRYWRPDDYTGNSMLASSLGIIRGLSAEEEMLEKIENIEGVISDKTFETNGNSVEIDAIVVNDDGVHLIELKNIWADEIIIEPSGVAYKMIQNEKQRMDDLFSQVGRARDIIREIVGPKVNIYNVIVFANKDTQITTRLESDNLQVIDLGYLSFIFQNKQYTNPLNDQIVDKLLAAQIPKRKYDFYDIYGFKKELITAYQRDKKIYDEWYNIHERELEEIGNYRIHMEEKLLAAIQQSKINKRFKNTLKEAKTEIIQQYFTQNEQAFHKNLSVPKEDIEHEIKRLTYGIDVLTAK